MEKALSSEICALEDGVGDSQITQMSQMGWVEITAEARRSRARDVAQISSMTARSVAGPAGADLAQG